MTGRRLPVAARLLRIWQVAERIAVEPGHTRASLAVLFHLSERQIQADLNVIREGMGLPLVRQRGYRFADEGASVGPAALSLHRALVLLMVLDRAARDPSVPSEELDALAAWLPTVLPPHVRPIVAAVALTFRAARPAAEQRVLLAILHALLRGRWVRLDGMADGDEPIVRPDVVLPFLGQWYVVGERYRPARPAAFALGDVGDVTMVTVEARTVRRAHAS